MDRYYAAYDITVRDSIVATLLLWNTANEYANADHDFMFTQFLLIDVFGGEKLAGNDLDKNKLRFIKELLNIRVKEDSNRSSKFESFVNTVIKQFDNKRRSEQK